ncbi:MAG: PqqD family protein [Gemmatimonadota bacterium]
MSSNAQAGEAQVISVGPLAPKPRQAVIVSATPDGSVLYSTETEQYFGLNKTGTFIWDSLHPKSDTVEDICVALQAAFPSGLPDQIAIDVRRLLGRLVEKQLVDVRGSPSE